MRENILKALVRESGLEKTDVENLLESPKDQKLGDLALPCFILSKKYKKSPVEISLELVNRLNKKRIKGVFLIESKGPYVNFFFDRKDFSFRVLENLGDKNYGFNKDGKGKKILIDMSSPNIAKPFGIGHLRSTIIGNSLSRIVEANGYTSVKFNYLGDWGTQFGKIIFAYKKWGEEKKLKEDPIKYLLKLYVRANDESYAKSSREEFKKLEEGDKKNLALWKKFRKYSLDEFKKVYGLLGVSFDVFDAESFDNSNLNSIKKSLEKKKLLKLDQGARIVDLRQEDLGVVLIEKSDGTSLYATRDIASAIRRKKEYGFSKMIYEVGVEQKLHFSQFFRVLDLMGNSWSKDLVHVSHGLYLDKDGKKFSTRKGKTLFMRDILEEVIDKAKKKLDSSEKNISKKELERRAIIVANAAIFYNDMKKSLNNNVVFDPNSFLSFEGDTGPYLLYSYARANSVLKKARKLKFSKLKKLEVDYIKDSEYFLLKKIDEFSKVVKRSYLELSPNLIANYSYELSKLFNEFYHNSVIVGNPEEDFRLRITCLFMQTLKKSLGLLGIETLEEM